MGALFSAFANWLGGIFSSLFALMSSHFLATKIVLTVLFVTVVPIVLNNLLYDLIDELISFVLSNMDTNTVLSQTVFQFTDLAGWLIQTMQLDTAFSVVISAVALKFTLKLIPFVRV